MLNLISLTSTNTYPSVMFATILYWFCFFPLCWSANICLHVKLDAPTNIVIGDETESSFRVSWDHTQAEIDGYMLTYSSSAGLSEEIPIGPNTSSHELAGLMPGLHYAVAIWAIKGSKSGKRSAAQARTDFKSVPIQSLWFLS